MIKNYIKIAFRNLFKTKVYSAINIFGLAVGIACCILIALYVNNEWSYDQFHTNSDRIYRAWVKETTQDGRRILNTATPAPLFSALDENIPEVQYVTYLYTFSNLVQLKDNEQPFNEQILVAGTDFFRMFDFELLQGHPSAVFENPSSVVLSQEMARRYFGNKDPLQKTLSIRLGSEFVDFTVTGVVKNAPSNSSLQYQIIIPDTNLPQLINDRSRNSWFNIFGSTYVMLQEGASPSNLEPKFRSMMKGILGDKVYERTEYTVGLQPLTDIHLNTDYPTNLASVSDPMYSYILAALALLVLLIACVNFMTLSISRSTTRAKEVGIRKTIGARRQHLMYQFWGEALLMTVIALGAGITFAELLLPLFNDLSATSLQLDFSLVTIFVMGLATLLISIVAGIYPALILSGFQPVEVLKGRLNLSADKSFFRKSMVIFQFSLSIALIIGTIFIIEQLDYVQNKDLGYLKDEIVVIESGLSAGPGAPISELFDQGNKQKKLFQNQLQGIHEVNGITVSSFTPVQMGGWFRLGFPDEQGQNHSFHGNIVDADFIPTMGIKVVKGRAFSDENPSDKRQAVVVNQALVDYFGWENPIGKQLPGPEFIDHEIIGVVENFHYESLHTPVGPLAMAMNSQILFSGVNNMSLSNSPSPRFSVKVSTGDLSATMDQIQQVWKQVAPATPFNYTFVDQAVDSQYRQERRLSRIVTFGSVLAIVIACLGLFGLASLMIERRTKEIGVRKVLGASSSNIVLLVNKEFTKLIVIAFIIAVPIAWYGMQQWLKEFAYKITLGVWVFLGAGMLTLLVAWLAVSYQSIKATMINPVESLRSE